MSRAIRCRFCGCTHDAPCVLTTGETCLLSIPAAMCNNPRCIVAADAARRVQAARRAQEIDRQVRPVVERWHRQWAAERERRKRRSLKKAKKPHGRAA